MRNFDNWLRYKDNNSKPLHGCIMFNVKDGNTTAPIYDSDGTALDNPILTDEYGRTQHQVFIDTDVVAYFYKYIGEGTWTTQHDIDISDDTKWALQYTSENINETKFELTSNAATCVNTIADLRALDVSTVPLINGYKVITLLGYNACGDKEPINYIWYSQSEDNDDNGAVIKSTALLTGRWKMVKPTEHCDSRHYGIFPQNTTNFNGDTARMLQWIDYCNASNIRPYFSANGDYKYYKYNNLSFTTPIVDIAKNVTFLDTGTSNIWTTEFNGDPLFNNHATNLATKTVKTSWGAYAFINPEHVIVDNNDYFYNTTLSNCKVDLNVTCDKVCAFTNCTVNLNKSLNSISSFTNCIINSKNNISAGCYFTNCKLTEDMFYGSPYIHVDTNCIADFNDFEHKQLMWLRIKDQQQQVNYDWEGMLTQQNPWENVIDSDRWLLNYKSTNANAELKESNNPHTYFIENCAGAITLQGKAANTYVFKNSEMTVTIADTAVTGCSIRCQDSTLSFTQDRIRLANLNSQNGTLLGTGSFDVDNAYLYNSAISIDVHCGYCDVKDCNIANTIQVYGVNQPDAIIVDPTPTATAAHTTYEVHRIISGNFVNNFVAGNIEIGTIDAQDPHISLADLVRGLNITNNVGLSAEPITVHRSLSSVYDNYNIYTYKGNTGTMEMRTNNITGVININGGNESHYNKMWEQMGVYGLTNTTERPDDSLFLANFFTIGTSNVTVMVQVEHSGMMAGLGADVGVTCPLNSEGTYYWKSMTKSAGSQFEWKVQNMPLFVGMASEADGDTIQFNVVQL